MYYANFRIQEQVSVPWCGEIQNQRLEIHENTFNFHSNSTLCPRSVVSQSISKGRKESGLHFYTHHFIPYEKLL